jgi:uncharacterized membrane protein YqaE (UPF0057 family)
MNEKIIVESAKDALRIVVLAIIPVVVAGLESGGVDWILVANVGLIALLKFIDSLLHEYGKAEKKTSLVTGLTRF